MYLIINHKVSQNYRELINLQTIIKQIVNLLSELNYLYITLKIQ